jgi:hypothetical protein
MSEELAVALRLLKVKVKCNLTDEAFQETMIAFNNNSEPISLHKVKKKLKSIVNIKPIWEDMCPNSCCAYTGSYNNLINCPICKSERYQNNRIRQPRQQFAYFSIIERLTIQYGDYDRAKELRYRTDYVLRRSYRNNNQIGDIFDGTCYKELVQNGHFQDERDVALIASIDGYQIFRQKTDDCWILLLINANLNPEIRVKKENLLISLIIPGPKEPKDFNTFLYPIIQELQILEGILNYLIKNI